MGYAVAFVGGEPLFEAPQGLGKIGVVLVERLQFILNPWQSNFLKRQTGQ